MRSVLIAIFVGKLPLQCFKEMLTWGYSFVAKQPEGEDEQLAIEAMEDCPVEAIANYGAPN